ncbi:hypothetical protein [Roseococcus sp.]|uniref:hypothetical protein n=1 Tax=Roseococcus sp. TaxID=2109646 RepID=UPI003BAA5239
MRPALILLTATLLTGCGLHARSPGQRVTAPDPTVYPAPAEGMGRYLPWASGWNDRPPMVVGGPLRISPPDRSTPERDPTGFPPTGR